MPNALEAKDLDLRFGGQAVLRGFSLSPGPGDKALPTGPSGLLDPSIFRNRVKK